VACKNCGELKPHHAKGLCRSCYDKNKIYKRKEKYCPDCHKPISKVSEKCSHCWQIGRKLSDSAKIKLSESHLGNKSPLWKGDKVGYKRLHAWIRKNKSKPEFCEECNINKPSDVANISGEYKRDINDYRWLCRRCHLIQDGIIHKQKLGG
jgi:hypothetical protein